MSKKQQRKLLSGTLEIASCLFDPKIFATPDKPLSSGFYWTDEINAWELMGHQGGPLFANFVYDENGNTYNISSEVFVDPIPTPENWWDEEDDGKLAMFVIPENQPNGFIKDIKNGSRARPIW